MTHIKVIYQINNEEDFKQLESFLKEREAPCLLDVRYTNISAGIDAHSLHLVKAYDYESDMLDSNNNVTIFTNGRIHHHLSNFERVSGLRHEYASIKEITIYSDASNDTFKHVLKDWGYTASHPYPWKESFEAKLDNLIILTKSYDSRN